MDFHRPKVPPSPVNVQGIVIEIVDSYKYLGVHFNKNFDWTDNTQAFYMKGKSRLHLLHRLMSFGVREGLLRTCYDSVVASAMFYAVAAWGSSITASEREKLDRLVKRAGSVLGCSLDPVEVVSDRRMVAKLPSILDNVSHPLHKTVIDLESSVIIQLRHPQCIRE